VDTRFTKSRRLKRAKDIDQVFKEAQTVKGRHTTLLTRPNEKNLTRIVIIASRKKIGKANKRTRIKRQIKESFRYWQSQIDAVRPLDIVVIVKSSALQLSSEQWFDYLSKQWRRVIKLYKG